MLAVTDDPPPKPKPTARKKARGGRFMSPKAYADHRGITRFAVQYAINQGRLTAPAATFDGKRWKIDAPLADAQWAKTTRARASGRATVDAAAVQLAASDLAGSPIRFGPHDIPIDADGKPLAPVLVAAIKCGVEAQIKQLELAEKRRALVPAHIAEERLEHLGRSLRDGVLSVPARLAHQLAAESDPVQCEILLEQALVAALLALVEKGLGP